jgi:hypothetical protein
VRRLFTLAAALSLLLFLATMALWMRGFLVEDRLHWHRPFGYMFLTSSHGRLSAYCWINKEPTGPKVLFRETLSPQALDDSRQPWVIRYVRVPGFTLRTGAAQPARALFDVTVSSWLVALTTALLPIYWVVLYRGKWRREARLRAGCCISCGYDLTANTSGICPECGTPIGSNSGPASAP